MKGRPPKPLEQRRREGNPGHRPLPQPVLVGGRQPPSLPAGLSAAQRAVWRVLVADLNASGVLDHADGAMVEAAAVSLSRAREARAILNAEGVLSVNSQGRVAHPAIAIEREAWVQFRQVADHLGLSPSARARLGLSLVRRDSMERELERELGTPPRLRTVGGK